MHKSQWYNLPGATGGASSSTTWTSFGALIVTSSWIQSCEDEQPILLAHPLTHSLTKPLTHSLTHCLLPWSFHGLTQYGRYHTPPPISGFYYQIPTWYVSNGIPESGLSSVWWEPVPHRAFLYGKLSRLEMAACTWFCVNHGWLTKPVYCLPTYLPPQHSILPYEFSNKHNLILILKI